MILMFIVDTLIFIHYLITISLDGVIDYTSNNAQIKNISMIRLLIHVMTNVNKEIALPFLFSTGPYFILGDGKCF